MDKEKEKIFDMLLEMDDKLTGWSGYDDEEDERDEQQNEDEQAKAISKDLVILIKSNLVKRVAASIFEGASVEDALSDARGHVPDGRYREEFIGFLDEVAKKIKEC